MTQPTLISLHPSEYTQGLCYYPFAVNWDRCVGISNTLIDLSDMSMRSRQNGRFKSNGFQYDYRNK